MLLDKSGEIAPDRRLPSQHAALAATRQPVSALPLKRKQRPGRAPLLSAASTPVLPRGLVPFLTLGSLH